MYTLKLTEQRWTISAGDACPSAIGFGTNLRHANSKREPGRQPD
jgi:hypothetical protein